MQRREEKPQVRERRSNVARLENRRAKRIRKDRSVATAALERARWNPDEAAEQLLGQASELEADAARTVAGRVRDDLLTAAARRRRAAEIAAASRHGKLADFDPGIGSC